MFVLLLALPQPVNASTAVSAAAAISAFFLIFSPFRQSSASSPSGFVHILYKMQTPFMLKCFSADFSSVTLFCPKKFIVFGEKFFLFYAEITLPKVYFKINFQIVK